MAAAVDPRVLRPKNLTAGAGDYASLFEFEEWHKMAILCLIPFLRVVAAQLWPYEAI